MEETFKNPIFDYFKGPCSRGLVLKQYLNPDPNEVGKYNHNNNTQIDLKNMAAGSAVISLEEHESQNIGGAAAPPAPPATPPCLECSV